MPHSQPYLLVARIFKGMADIFSLSANGVGGEGRGEVAREPKPTSVE